MSELAALTPRQDILDVACGTGILARKAFERVAPSGLRIERLQLEAGRSGMMLPLGEE